MAGNFVQKGEQVKLRRNAIYNTHREPLKKSEIEQLAA